MNTLKAVLVFLGLKLAELSAAAIVIYLLYLVIHLTPGIVFAILFIALILVFCAFMLIDENGRLNDLYMQDGPLMKVVGLITVSAALPLLFILLSIVLYHLGRFYNYLASLVGWVLVKPTPYSVDFFAAGFMVTTGLFLVAILGTAWVISNIEWTKEILDKNN